MENLPHDWLALLALFARISEKMGTSPT